MIRRIFATVAGYLGGRTRGTKPAAAIEDGGRTMLYRIVTSVPEEQYEDDREVQDILRENYADVYKCKVDALTLALLLRTGYGVDYEDSSVLVVDAAGDAVASAPEMIYRLRASLREAMSQ